MKKNAAGEWLVNFKGRNHSGTYNQNFLWRNGTIYVMDNHRAALWCWLQHVDPNKSHSIFHIDRHTDTLRSRLDEWLEHCPTFENLSIDNYLNHLCPYELGTYPLFRWDNYLSIYFAKYGSFINTSYFATHHEGDKPNLNGTLSVNLWSIPSNLDYWLDSEKGPWILNIDLDYFFWHEHECPGIMVSDAYLNKCFDILRQKIEDGTVAVTTICLTPHEEFTGGWKPSERLMERILPRLGIEFKLPQNH